ncbi:MAG TPA: HAD-IIB family hydrolase [Acholeplasmataceae bacterium]|nr:HAD-IIB family hydrolase [Acholeplasmataceae bacterium]HQC30150.1 HAD-IIB family hydrolase [Acholeplasmataceae bacterium]
MKKIIFFDIDNTLVDSETFKVPSETLRLLEELSKRDDYYLGIATGRGPGRLKVISDIVHFFDAFVFSNGSYVTLNGKVVYDQPIEAKRIKEVLKVAQKHDLLLGVSGLDGDALIRRQEEGIIDLKNEAKLEPDYYLNNQIYQVWLVSTGMEKLLLGLKELPNFNQYLWTRSGVDLTVDNHSKGTGILKVKALLEPIEVISIGDGYNDIDMIEVADIGIAMGNSKVNELKEKADLIGPSVKENKLYEFLKSHGII